MLQPSYQHYPKNIHWSLVHCIQYQHQSSTLYTFKKIYQYNILPHMRWKIDIIDLCCIDIKNTQTNKTHLLTHLFHCDLENFLLSNITCSFSNYLDYKIHTKSNLFKKSTHLESFLYGLSLLHIVKCAAISSNHSFLKYRQIPHSKIMLYSRDKLIKIHFQGTPSSLCYIGRLYMVPELIFEVGKIVQKYLQWVLNFYFFWR
eukprot:TRINITY_DN5828_c0_g3_i1.p2 TRINITY_DN5828_c0_g3~~TRINITY_DN5828_c0_g3_i1.p2  ORF type:complete len:202 (+),score=-20.37 TRINITY_DN5828_c0_g3_i1:574-1179(+)